MVMESWLMYLICVLIATATPGPAVVFIMTNSIIYGWRKSIYAAFGNVIGLLGLGIISITGLGTILYTSQIIFTGMKYAGAAYFIYLGFKMITQKECSIDMLNVKENDTNITSRKMFLKALGVAVSNPKAIIFLTALFPQFINFNENLTMQFTILIVVLILFSFIFLFMYALLAFQAKHWLLKPGRIRNVNRIGGSIFLGFGVMLASASNR